MFKCVGKIQIANGVRINTDIDIIRYYQRLIDFHYYWTVKTQLPMHGAHITIVNPKIHKISNFRKYWKFHGMDIEFEYFPEKMYVSPKNWWIPVKCQFAEQLKNSMGIKESRYYLGLHMTVANKKFES